MALVPCRPAYGAAVTERVASALVVQDACGAGDPEAGQRALANIVFMGDAIVTDTAGFRAALVDYAAGAS